MNKKQLLKVFFVEVNKKEERKHYTVSSGIRRLTQLIILLRKWFKLIFKPLSCILDPISGPILFTLLSRVAPDAGYPAGISTQHTNVK
jgi:hypothetical protein